MPDNLGHASYQPYSTQPIRGDVVRERKTNTDWVISSISGGALTGGTIIYLLSLYGRQVKQYIAENYSDLNKDYGHVWHNNVDRLTPDQVRAKFNDQVEKMFNSNKDIIQHLHEPDNQVLKDLLMIASNSDEHLDKRIISIAENIVLSGHGMPTKNGILDTLKKSASPQVDQNFIESLAQRIFDESTAVAKKNRMGMGTKIPTDLTSNFISRGDGSLNTTAESILAQARQGFDGKAYRKLGDNDIDKMVGNVARNLFGKVNENALALKEVGLFGLSPEQKMKTILGRTFSSKAADYLMKSAAKQISSQIEQGNITQLGLDIIGKPEFVKMLEREAVNQDIARQTLSRNFYPYLSKQRGKRTALSTGRIITNMRASVDWNALSQIPDSTQSGSQFLSIDRETFLSDLIGNSKFNIGNRKNLNLNNQAVLEEVKKMFGFDQNVIAVLPPSAIKAIKEAEASGKPVNLKAIAKIASAYKQQLSTKAIDNLEAAAYGKLSGFSGPRVLALETKKLTKTVGNTVSKSKSVMQATGDVTGYISDVLALPKVEEGMQRMFMITDKNEKNILGSTNINTLLNHAAGKIFEDHSGIRYLDVPATKFTNHVNDMTDMLAEFQGASELVDSNLMERHDDININSLQGLKELSDRLEHKLKRKQISYDNISLKGQFGTPEQAYQYGKESIKVAYAQIKNKKESRLIGSNMNITVKDQLSRARKFVSSNNSMILDIERATDDRGISWVTEIGLGKVVNGDITQILKQHSRGIGQNHAARAQALIDLSHAIKDVDVIGTQTASDFNEIMNMMGHLRTHFKADTNMSRRLSKAEAVFKATIKNKLFDIQVIHQVAGGKAGSLSQGYLEAVYGFGVQTHKGFVDVQRSYELIKKVLPDFNENIDNLELRSLPSRTFYDHNPMSPTFGMLRELVHVRDTHDGISAIFQEKRLVSKNGKFELKNTGNFFEEDMDSVSMLAARLHKFSRQINEIDHDFMTERNQAVGEGASRKIRQYLNPLSKTYWDEVGGYNSTKSGPFAALQYRVESEAANLYGDVKQLYAGGKSVTSASTMHQDLWNKHVRKVITEKYGDRVFTDPTSETEFARRVGHQLNKMFSQTEADRITHTSLQSFRSSDLGKTLHNLAELDAVNHSSRYAMFSEMLMSHIAEHAKMGEDLTSTTNYAPRFSLMFNMGNHAESSNKLLTLQTHHNIFMNASEDVAGKILFSLRDAPEEKLEQMSGYLGMSSKFLKTTQTQLKKYSEMKNITDNLEAWKQAVADLGYIDKGSQFAKLRQAKNQIYNSKGMTDQLTKSIGRKIDQAEGDVRAVGEELLEGAKVIHKNSQKGFAASLQEQLISMYSDGEGGMSEKGKLLNKLFTDSHTQLDVAKITKAYTNPILESISTAVEQLHSSLAPKELENAMLKVTEQRSQAFLAGERGIAQQGAGGSHLWDLHEAMMERPAPTVGEGRETLQEAVLETKKVSSTSTVMAQNELILTNDFEFSSKLNKLAVPLMAVGGVLGLWAASHSPNDDNFSQGKISDKSSNPMLVNAEIPGRGSSARIWHGEEAPFKLNITFTGFIKSREEHDALMGEVYNSITGHMEFQNKTTKVEDRRVRDHSQNARDAIKRL